MKVVRVLRKVLLVIVLGVPELAGRCDLGGRPKDSAAETRARRLAPTGRGKPPGGNSRSATAELALPLGLRDVGYARLSSSTGMVRTPAVWRAYSAKPG